LYRTLGEAVASFPPEFATHRVIPSLAAALEFGGSSAANILPLILQLGQNVASEDFASVIITPLIKLFASPDRGTRMALLDHLPQYVDKLDKKTVDAKIFPHFVGNLIHTFSSLTSGHSKPDSRTQWLSSGRLPSSLLFSWLQRFARIAHCQSDSHFHGNTLVQRACS
jgi:hypothetical protein